MNAYELRDLNNSLNSLFTMLDELGAENICLDDDAALTDKIGPEAAYELTRVMASLRDINADFGE